MSYRVSVIDESKQEWFTFCGPETQVVDVIKDVCRMIERKGKQVDEIRVKRVKLLEPDSPKSNIQTAS